MNTAGLGNRFVDWAKNESSIQLLVQIGSRVRPHHSGTGPDKYSDWDFQIACSEPEKFSTSAWLASKGVCCLAYVVRTGRLGSAQKASAVTDAGELDLVVLPVEPLRDLVRRVGRHGYVEPPAVRSAMQDLGAVLAGGYQILKGAVEFGELYSSVAQDPFLWRIDDTTVRQLADGFVCDYVSTHRKLQRGELLAAQRWLHHQLAEANFRLAHELRLRRGQTSFPDARRIERLSNVALEDVTVSAYPKAADLRKAVEAAANGHRRLMTALLGDKWRWPDLKCLDLGAE